MSINRMRQGGLTMIELIMFMVIIGVALAGILQVLNFTTKNSADPMRQKQALMIAEALLEEVRLSAFTFCEPGDAKVETAASAAECTAQESFGLAAGEATSRPHDNINDYVAAAGTATAAFNDGTGNLTDANGNKIDVAGYTAQVTIRPAVLNDIGDNGTSADTDVLRITVEVGYDGQTLALDAYRTRYAPNFP